MSASIHHADNVNCIVYIYIECFQRVTVKHGLKCEIIILFFIFLCWYFHYHKFINFTSCNSVPWYLIELSWETVATYIADYITPQPYTGLGVQRKTCVVKGMSESKLVQDVGGIVQWSETKRSKILCKVPLERWFKYRQ